MIVCTLIVTFLVMSVSAASVSAASSKSVSQEAVNTKTIGNIVVDFTGNPRSGEPPLDVQFTGIYTGPGTPQWSWKFGDGGTSTEQNPLHRYESPGKYSVTLTVKSVFDSGFVSKTVTKGYYITVGSALPPVAAFLADPVSGSVPLTVQFTDQSTGTPTKWLWSFGDRTFSTQQDPSHTYTKAGKYTVSLTVMNADGGDTETKYGLITVS
jgi:PKD repeat protein